MMKSDIGRGSTKDVGRAIADDLASASIPRPGGESEAELEWNPADDLGSFDEVRIGDESEPRRFASIIGDDSDTLILVDGWDRIGQSPSTGPRLIGETVAKPRSEAEDPIWWDRKFRMMVERSYWRIGHWALADAWDQESADQAIDQERPTSLSRC